MSPCSFDFDEDRLMWSDSIKLWAELQPCGGGYKYYAAQILVCQILAKAN